MRTVARRLIVALGLVAALTIIDRRAAWADRVVVVPETQATVEGNSENAFPFNCSLLALASQRYQQVYLGSEVGSGSITRIAFRPDSLIPSAFAPTTIPGVTITLSSTTAAPDSLSAIFAANVGADVTTVFSGSLTLSSADVGGPPRHFDIVIPLGAPFRFDATTGRNLLLDVTIPTCAATARFDAQNTAGDPVSRATTIASGAGSGTADLVDTVGLVTQFTLAVPTAAPTIGPIGLLACAVILVSVGLWSIRRYA
ncbi:MAG: hypothetical protein ACHQ9S_01555 [Candidatus Binatia bacterium]